MFTMFQKVSKSLSLHVPGEQPSGRFLEEERYACHLLLQLVQPLKNNPVIGNSRFYAPIKLSKTPRSPKSIRISIPRSAKSA